MPETKPVTYEQRLSEVEKLLTDVTGNKTLEGRSDHALRDAEKAYTLATTRPRLPTRHASEAAYRLAHLRLRKPCSKAKLIEIAELFKEASELSTLAALAHIYRMAVLHRLSLMTPSKKIDDQVSESFRCARTALAAVDVRYESGDTSDRNRQTEVPIQDWAFNLLELSAYVTDQPYDPLLMGWGGRPELHLTRGDWVIVKSDSDRNPLRYTKDDALQALAEWEKRSRSPQRAPKDEVVFFVLGPSESKWKVPGRAYTSAPEPGLRLLAALVDARPDSTVKLAEIARQGDNAAHYKHHLKKKLQELLGHEISEVYGARPRGSAPRLLENFVVYGAVHVRNLSYYPYRDVRRRQQT